MSEFKLDTSGEVRATRLIEQPDGNWRSHWSWPDLSPFEQGYVEAMFASLHTEGGAYVLPTADGGEAVTFFPKFRDLAPETLARIREDCAGWMTLHTSTLVREQGADFWRARQSGEVYSYAKPPTEDFPILTVYLGDDGLIRFREVS